MDSFIIKDKYTYFKLSIVLFTVLVSGSLYYSTFYKNLLLIFPLLASLPYAIFNCKSILLDNKILLIFYTAALVLLNPNFVLSSSLVLMILMFSGFIITRFIKFEEFSTFYINIIIFLCLTSWFYFIVLKFQIPSPFPDFLSIVDTPYSNFIFFGIYRAELPSSYMDLYYATRNSGVFWEPGAFQIFVNIGFYLCIVNNILTKKRFFIFLVTIVSIDSSFGLVAFIFLLFLFIIKDVKYKKIIFILLLLMLLFLIKLSIFDSTLNKFIEGSSSNVSYIARLFDFQIDLKILKENIWNGVGYGNLYVREEMGRQLMGESLYWSAAQPPGADGLLLFLSYLGIFGLIIMGPLIYPCQIRGFTCTQKILVIFTMVTLYNSENMFPYLITWVMFFYGVQKNADIRQERKILIV